jgi:hypothetical protein
MRMRRIVICGLSGSNLFPTLSRKQHNFRGKVIELKMCGLIFSTNFVWNISHCEKNWTRCYHNVHISVCMCSTAVVYRSVCAVLLLCIGLYVQYCYCISVCVYSTAVVVRLQWNLFSRQTFEMCSSTKFHANLSCAVRFVPCGQTDRQVDSRTDMTKLIVTLLNFSNVPNERGEEGCSDRRYIYCYYWLKQKFTAVKVRGNARSSCCKGT